MNQLTQLFRFLIPGGFFIIYYFLFLQLFRFDIETDIKKIKDMFALIIFLIPAIGYFSSILHHLLYNLWPYYRIDISKIITTEKKYDKQWIEFNIRWRKQSHQKWYEAFDNRNNSLTDLMHGNGAILISFLLAVVFSAVRVKSSTDSFEFDKFNATILGIIFIVHCCSYFRTKKHAGEFVTRALEELEISDQKIQSSQGQP
jgi:hypothetical protein